ncbi:MAG TPA: DUF5686 family protein [Draconibacterium sp.]|nr:DUF5686 family protein [Draconibacterium sp.]
MQISSHFLVHLKRYFVLLIILTNLLISFVVNGQVLAGRIVNEQFQPVPYATIFVQETREGTISNPEGLFSMKLNRGTYHLTIRSLGYLQIEKEVHLNSDSLYLPVMMQRQEFQIKEIKVFPGKEDPAMFIIRKAITKAPYYRDKIKHYEADLYIKSNFTFTNIPRLYQNKVEIDGKKMKDVLKEDMTYVIESQNKITYDYPQQYKQQVISKRTSLVGFDEPPVMELMTSSFYDERPNQLISPLSSQALKHYNFTYEGFITAGNSDIFKIKVEPKRKSDELVEGYLYIVDKLWCIYSLDFNAQMEFFHYRIKQQFQNLGNENWLPVSHLIEGHFSMLGLRGNFYYGASLKYNAVEDNEIPVPATLGNQTADTSNIQKKSEKEKELRNEVAQITSREELTNRDVKKAARLNRKILKEQYKDSSLVAPSNDNYKVKELKDTLQTNREYWDTIRAIPLTPAEMQSYQFTDSIRTEAAASPDSTKGKNEAKKKSLFMRIFKGDRDFCKDSLIQLGYSGIISADNADFNAVDGYKYKQQFSFRANPDLGKYITIVPELGYAFNRKALFGSVKSKLVNILLKNNQLQLAGGKESRDFKPASIGIKPALNSISSWFFAQNYMKLYETTFATLDFQQEILPDFYWKLIADYNQFKPLTNNVHYRLSDKKDYSPNLPKGLAENNPALQQQKSFALTTGFQFRKFQRKPWLTKSPFLFISDFYSFQSYFRQGVKNVFSSDSDFNQIDFQFHQQANISPVAGIDWSVNAGYFFKANQMHFSQFKHFRTAEIPVSFSAFTHTFQLLNDYEFSTNQSYFTFNGEFRTEYLLLRYLSILNKRTWSESLHLNYLSTPALKNYWEAGYSLNSLFFAGNVGVFAGFEGSKFNGVVVKFSISGL